jgi:hypothetical protein
MHDEKLARGVLFPATSFDFFGGASLVVGVLPIVAVGVLFFSVLTIFFLITFLGRSSAAASPPKEARGCPFVHIITFGLVTPISFLRVPRRSGGSAISFFPRKSGCNVPHLQRYSLLQPKRRGGIRITMTWCSMHTTWQGEGAGKFNIDANLKAYGWLSHSHESTFWLSHSHKPSPASIKNTKSHALAMTAT